MKAEVDALLLGLRQSLETQINSVSNRVTALENAQQKIVTITCDITEACWVSSAETIEDNTILIWDNTDNNSANDITYPVFYGSPLTQMLQLEGTDIYPELTEVPARTVGT